MSEYVMTKLEVQALYELAEDMGLRPDHLGSPCYQHEGEWLTFDPLTSDRAAFRVQVVYALCMEVTEYGVFIRVTNGRMLLWKEFPKNFTVDQELAVCRKALFDGACRIVREKRQQAELDAGS